MGSPAASNCIAPFFANLVATAAEQELFPAAPGALGAVAGDPDPGAAGSALAGERLGLRAALRPPPLPRQGWGGRNRARATFLRFPPAQGLGTQCGRRRLRGSSRLERAAQAGGQQRAPAPEPRTPLRSSRPGLGGTCKGRNSTTLGFGSFVVEVLNNLADSLPSLHIWVTPYHTLHLQEQRAIEKQKPKSAGGPAMRGYLVAIFLSAVFLYYVLYCILWGTNIYGVPPGELKSRNNFQTCLSKPAFAPLLRFPQFHPLLCESDFMSTVILSSSDQFDLPYGTRKSATYFKLALSKLQNCDLFDEFDKVPCKRCVVVGNGGVLRNKSLGKKIDSYDVIIRMNNGPILGHEEDVGRKTTFRVFYPESVFSNISDNDPNSTVILAAFKPVDLKWLLDMLSGGKINTSGFWKKPPLNLIYQPYQIRILHPFIVRMAAYELLHFPKVFPRKQKPKHPTTGIIAITFAFHICHEVHLAGFKYNFSNPNSPLHYYGNATMSLMRKTEYHNLTAEQLFLKDIIEKKFVIDLTQD